MSRQTTLGRFGFKKAFRAQNYIYPFQTLSLGFILKIFLKFRKFQPRYSYKIYSYRKKRVYANFVKIQPIVPDKRVRPKASNLLVILIEPLSLK